MSRVINQRWAIGTVSVLIALCLGLITLYVFGRDPYFESEIRQLIQPHYDAQRPEGARLSGASYVSPGKLTSADGDLGHAQILLLRQPDSTSRQQLQGLIYLAAGKWQSFIDLADRFPSEISGRPDIQNNLGVAYLALAQSDDGLLRALDAFERAAKADNRLAEPYFNLVITYRKLRFSDLADETLKKYSGFDPSSSWQRELSNTKVPDESDIADQLRHAVESSDIAQAERLFEKNTDLCRRLAMGYALRKAEEEPGLIEFIAAQMEKHYGDRTISAMIAPLATDKRDSTVMLRDYVMRGANLFAEGNLSGSMDAYAEAVALLRKTDSLFDDLWINLNRAETQIRLAKFEDARQALQRITSVAHEQHLTWVLAKALSVYGSTLRLTSSYAEMLNRVEEANRMFLQIDAPNDRYRTLYYLAAYRYAGGDQQEALRLALDGLHLTNEPARISLLHWLIASVLYRKGMPDRAILFAKESVERGRNGRYASGVEFTTLTTMAQLYESIGAHKLAEEYLKEAEEALSKFPSGFDHDKGEMLLGSVKARTAIDLKRYPEAESLLRRNLDVYARQPFRATPLLSQSLMLSAQVYSATGRVSEAAQKFNEAIDVIENDDQYLKTEGLRVKFDDERRELYDSAIEFEYSNGSPEAAWTYLQKYRAKLFLEFLAAFNPNIAEIRAHPDSASVQKRLPKDTQVVEYALLKDRLLIWFVTDKLFTVRSIAVSRTDLEDKVQKVLKKLRDGDDADALLMELGSYLIEPINKLLDSTRSITIIPDRALHGLPFAALRRPGRAQYLIQEFPIVVSPSLGYFLAGDETQPRRDAIVEFGSQNGGSSELRELTKVSTIYPKATMYSGSRVDKSGFLEAIRKAGVFHYAGHSATDAVDPLRSSILLDGNRSGPNSVTAVDISQQRLVNNALVVLSSCDSSVGNSRDGIGVRGLTSAFLISGAGAVVGSLWPVEASSTSELMIRFHRAFAGSQLSAANALREAQLSFMKSFPERSHPYYWSGFMVTGNFSALR